MKAGKIRFKLTWSSLWHLWHGGTRFVLEKTISILRVVLVLDVSKYQGLISFGKMGLAGVMGVIIKCGQGMALDPFFLTSWAKAKAAGMPRGTYWFYDSRVDPEEQAKKWANMISIDAGELYHWLDLEENYNGPYKGWKNWKIFLQEFMQLSKLPASKIGIYTGYYYWIANSPTTVADLNWFAQFWLWLAWYTTNPANVIIPKPWTKLMLWQYGTMGVDGKTANGEKYGVESLEVDENNFNGDEDEYRKFFGLSGVVTPPPNGGAMPDVYLKLTSVDAGQYRSIRSPMAANIDGVKIGQINANSTGKAYADDENKRVYTEDMFVNGTLKARAGDVWLRCFEANGSPIDGMIAQIHLGRVYLKAEMIGTPIPSPVPLPSILYIATKEDMSDKEKFQKVS